MTALVKGAVTLTAARNFECKIQLFEESARFEKITDAELVGHVNLSRQPTESCFIHNYDIGDEKKGKIGSKTEISLV